MCVIAVSLKGHKFSEKDLRKMWDSNSHGAGVAWIEKRGQVKVMKGLMSFDQFMEVYETVPETMHAVHFRLRSAGEILPQLTHPFRVDAVDGQKLTYTAKAVLFHNGTVSDWRSLYLAILSSFRKKEREKILSLQGVSDTYVMALMVYRYGHEILKHLDLGGKWLVFASQPVFYGFWDEDRKNGFKFSNLSWKYSLNDVRYRYSYGSLSSGWKGSWYKGDDDV